MTSPGATAEALAIFEGFLRGKGLKMTEQRRTMVRLALEQQGHFTAVDVHERLRAGGERVSLATVYRALGLLETAGILSGHDFEDGQRRYERALAREHHDHVICLDCRAVVEFQNESIETLQEQVLREHGFRMVHHALSIYASCQTLEEKGSCPRKDATTGPGSRAAGPKAARS